MFWCNLKRCAIIHTYLIIWSRVLPSSMGITWLQLVKSSKCWTCCCQSCSNRASKCLFLVRWPGCLTFWTTFWDIVDTNTVVLMAKPPPTIGKLVSKIFRPQNLISNSSSCRHVLAVLASTYTRPISLSYSIQIGTLKSTYKLLIELTALGKRSK